MAAHAIGSWLCTHAGVSPVIASIIPTELVAVGNTTIVAWLTAEFARELKIPQHEAGLVSMRFGMGPFSNRSLCRGGVAPFGGIFWFDPFSEMTDPSPLDTRQIFGHTPVPYPEVCDS